MQLMGLGAVDRCCSGLRPIVLVVGLFAWCLAAAQQGGSVAPCPLQQYRVPTWAKERGILAARIQSDVATASQAGDRRLTLAILCAGAAARVPLAEMALAAMLMEGRLGLDKHPVQARMWMERAARGGDSQAQFFLSNMYTSGQGGPVRLLDGMAWLRTSAEGGFAKAQFIYGAELYLGRYVQRDLDGSLLWLRRAARGGNPDARKMLRQLEREGIK